jgi:hypothetical protein
VTNSQPVNVSFYSLMAIQAARRRSGTGGAWRVWTLGKAFDVIGLGKVKRDDLRAFVIGLGVGDRTLRRWMNEARKNDFISDYQDKAGAWWVNLHNPARVARVMNLDHVGNRVTMAAGELIGTGWKARVFVSWEHGKQITREQIQKTVNVPVSTQRYRDTQAGTKRTRNYAKSTMRADKLAGVIEYGKYKAPFVTRDGFIAWRLPDMRTAEHIERVSKGRSRKINAAMRNGSGKGLSQMRRAFTDGGRRDIVRLFSLTDSQRRQAERKISRQDKRINDLYQRAETAESGAVIWKHYPAMG